MQSAYAVEAVDVPPADATPSTRQYYPRLYEHAFAQLERAGWQVPRVSAPCIAAFAAEATSAEEVATTRREATSVGTGVLVQTEPWGDWATVKLPAAAAGTLRRLHGRQHHHH